MKEWCGPNARNKKIPDFVLLNSDTRLLVACIDKYGKGDGTRYNHSDKYEYQRFSTSSKILAMQLQLGFARLRTFVSISQHRRKTNHPIKGREIRTGIEYTVSLFLNDHEHTNTGTGSFARIIGNFIATPIREIEAFDYDGPVGNAETEDHTYLVCNAVVHNCSHYKIAKEISENLISPFILEERATSHADVLERIRRNRCVVLVVANGKLMEGVEFVDYRDNSSLVDMIMIVGIPYGVPDEYLRLQV